MSLPALTLALFLAYSYVARGMAEPPAFDAIFSMYLNDPGAQLVSANLAYSVEGERIVVKASALPTGVRWNQALFRLDHQTLTIKRIEIEIPDDIEGYAQIIDVPVLADLTVSRETRAPDGYRLRSGYDRGPGLIGELFGPRRRGEISIEKLGVVHRIERPDGADFMGPVQFLAWIIP